MSDANDKLSDALHRIRKVADQHGAQIVNTSEISRQDRELLLRKHWLQEIIQGWYMLTRPDLADGDSAAWHANFWDFLRIYLKYQYGEEYCLSAEASIELHTGSTIMPQQVIVMVPKGGTMITLPFNTSVLTYGAAENIPRDRIEVAGLQVMPLAIALCKVAPRYFISNHENIEIALSSLHESAELLRVIIENNFQRAAERILGAYQFLQMNDKAAQMQMTLQIAGMKVSATNPFKQAPPVLCGARFKSPYAARIHLMWKKYREAILRHFPVAPGLPKNADAYMTRVDQLYEYDAYNSLSIEGYQVTYELIQRVRNHDWDPDSIQQDYEQRNALAARGYYEAFQVLKATLNKILNASSPGKCIAEDLSTWYQNLFAPAVRAELISLADLIGYRNDRVYIRNSLHAPPPKEAVLDCMEAFFSCLQEEESAAVRAVLGHYIFVFIHPYMDGNGRIARFILNTMLASGGYPWTVVQVSRRKSYIDCLETTHVEQDIEKFGQFVIEEMLLSEKKVDAP